MPQITIGTQTFEVDEQAKQNRLTVNGIEHDVDLLQIGADRYSMIIDGKSRIVQVVERSEKRVKVKVDGELLDLGVKNETDLLLERLGMNTSSKKEVKELKAGTEGGIGIENFNDIKTADIIENYIIEEVERKLK